MSAIDTKRMKWLDKDYFTHLRAVQYVIENRIEGIAHVQQAIDYLIYHSSRDPTFLGRTAWAARVVENDD